MIQRMSNLDIMKDEMKDMNEVKVSIVERMLQVEGDLYEYSPFIGENMLRVKDCFLCIDKTNEY